jgi:hypothetical protein
MTFEVGSRVRIPHRPDLPGHIRIELATRAGDGWQLFVEESAGHFQKVELTAREAAACEILTEDGAGDSGAVLAGLWTAWMGAAGAGIRSATLGSSPLKAPRAPDERSLRRDAPAAEPAVPARG